MKTNDIQVTQADYNKLQSLIDDSSSLRSEEKSYREALSRELMKAQIKSSDEIANDVITLHSRAQITDLETMEILEFTIVLPDEADVVMGARYVAEGGHPAATANQPWDDSVKGLTRYPDVLKWMDSNLDWTTSLGQAFIAQPADVMNAIQSLRTQAKTAGNLTDTPQQKVVMEKEIIRIVPAQQEVIYVPRYNPNIIYTQPYAEGVNPLLTFGAGFAVGAWLGYDFDWGNRGFYRGPWRGWGNGNGNGNGGGNNGNVNVVNITNNNMTVWQPSSASLAQQARLQRTNQINTRVVRINTLAATPNNNANVATSRDARQANRNGNSANILRPSSFATQADTPTVNAGKNQRNIPVATENTLPNGQPAAANPSQVVVPTANATPHGRHDTTGSGSSTVPTPAPVTAAPNVSGQTANPSQIVVPTENATRHGRHNTTTESGYSTAPTSAPPISNQSRPTTTPSRPNSQPSRNNTPTTAQEAPTEQQPRVQSSNRHAEQSVNTQAPSTPAPDKREQDNANSNANHDAAAKPQAQKVPAHTSQPAADKKKAASKDDKNKDDKTN